MTLRRFDFMEAIAEAKTQPCLGLIEDSSKSGSSLKYYELNRLEKCCVDRLSRQRLPENLQNVRPSCRIVTLGHLGIS
jgi:hypothetical protein